MRGPLLAPVLHFLIALILTVQSSFQINVKGNKEIVYLFRTVQGWTGTNFFTGRFSPDRPTDNSTHNQPTQPTQVFSTKEKKKLFLNI